jgi:hypothetical protein
MRIKHSKFKNTSILFEVLVKQITSDVLSGQNSPASKILKKYFTNTEIGKEYKMYESILKSKNVNESKANFIINSTLDSSKKLNRSSLKREKHNLIKELKNHYDINDLFRTKLKDYKIQASLYSLFEIYNSNKVVDPQQIVNNKVTLLEYLTSQDIEKKDVKDNLINEFKSYNKDLRILTYQVMLENFNERYSNLLPKQKETLKILIESVDNTSQLKDYYNKEIQYIKEELLKEIKKVSNKATKIKLHEIVKLLEPLDKKTLVDNEHLVDLLQYNSLLSEIKKSNG